MNNKQVTFNFRPLVIFSAVVVGLMLLGSAYVWLQTPAGAQIPVHFDATGTPDRYGGKAEGLLLLPAITLALCVMLRFLPNLEPRRLNLMQSIRVYRLVWGLVVGLMLFIHIGILLSVMGYNVNMVALVPLFVGLMLALIGNYMGKIRSNWFMGIRTPWTLTSELSWNRTHRLGGRLFIALGLLVMLGGLAGSSWWAVIVAVGSLAMVAVLFAYSYMVWKQDPAAQRG